MQALPGTTHGESHHLSPGPPPRQKSFAPRNSRRTAQQPSAECVKIQLFGCSLRPADPTHANADLVTPCDPTQQTPNIPLPTQRTARPKHKKHKTGSSTVLFGGFVTLSLCLFLTDEDSNSNSTLTDVALRFRGSLGEKPTSPAVRFLPKT